jgi:hypothetical protein
MRESGAGLLRSRPPPRVHSPLPISRRGRSCRRKRLLDRVYRGTRKDLRWPTRPPQDCSSHRRLTRLSIPAQILHHLLETPVHVITKPYCSRPLKFLDLCPSGKLYRDEIVYCPLECNVRGPTTRSSVNLTFAPFPSSLLFPTSAKISHSPYPRAPPVLSWNLHHQIFLFKRNPRLVILAARSTCDSIATPRPDFSRRTRPFRLQHSDFGKNRP